MTVHVGGRPTVRGPGRDALLLLLALAVTAGTLLALGMSGGTRSPDLSAQAHQVASTLRCPVCADLSAADSPSPMAAEMRRQVLRDLQRGRSPDQIRAGFVSAYGPSVLMTPPRSGVGSSACSWLSPRGSSPGPCSRVPAEHACRCQDGQLLFSSWRRPRRSASVSCSPGLSRRAEPAHRWA